MIMKFKIKEFGGFKFKVSDECKSYEGIIQSEIGRGVYSLPEKMKVLIDVGAHIGGTSILAASLGAEVYAYEPDKKNFDLLVENVKLNGFENKVHCFHQAIGRSGKRKLYVNDENTGGSGFFLNYFKPEKVETEIVDTISLEQVFEDNQIEYCDVLKADCEGCEYEFIPEAEKLFKKIGQISMEIHTTVQPEGQTSWDNSEKMMTLLEKFYKVDVLSSSAKSCKLMVCIKI